MLGKKKDVHFFLAEWKDVLARTENQQIKSHSSTGYCIIF